MNSCGNGAEHLRVREAFQTNHEHRATRRPCRRRNTSRQLACTGEDAKNPRPELCHPADGIAGFLHLGKKG